MKTTCSRARQLEIITSLYGPSKGSRAIYCSEKNPGVGLEKWEVVTKWSGEILSYYFPLTIFGNLEVFFVSFLLLYYCFVILIKYSRAQKGQKYFSPHCLSLCCSRTERLLSNLRFSFVFALWKLYKLPSKGYLSLNRLGHSLMLGANYLLHIFGVGF